MYIVAISCSPFDGCVHETEGRVTSLSSMISMTVLYCTVLYAKMLKS